jgi:hypothetical protein
VHDAYGLQVLWFDFLCTVYGIKHSLRKFAFNVFKVSIIAKRDVVYTMRNVNVSYACLLLQGGHQSAESVWRDVEIARNFVNHYKTFNLASLVFSQWFNNTLQQVSILLGMVVPTMVVAVLKSLHYL